MAAIRGKDTRPELALRAALRLLGATGYRLHRKELPGRPDITFMRWKVAVFVDGVFWHGHPDHWHPVGASEYWRNKIARTIDRDHAANTALAEMGWTVIRVWDQDVKADIGSCARLVTEALTKSGWAGPSSD
jgi:DNA mismatch endonuclease (patch repair protein)